MKVKPHPENTEYSHVSGAYVNIWVIDEDSEKAKARVHDYLSHFLWLIIEERYELEPTQAQIAQLDEEEYSNYSRAVEQGISAHFDASQKNPNGNAFSVETLKPPKWN